MNPERKNMEKKKLYMNKEWSDKVETDVARYIVLLKSRHSLFDLYKYYQNKKDLLS